MTSVPPNPIHSQFARAKKKWGQNFLIDGNIREKILDCAAVQPGETVLEIGPGKGFLTHGLLKRGAKVTAVEIDSRLVQMLQSRIDASSTNENDRAYKNLTLVQKDALKYDFLTLEHPYKVVANLPYNISTPLLFRLMDEKRGIKQMVLMLQKEVAERIVASTGSKAYGALSVVLQFYADIKLAFTVSPNCFQPKPKISSAVISITPLRQPRINVRDEHLFVNVVKSAFLYRRKRLCNALYCAGYPEAWVKSALIVTQTNGERRGETLTMQEFAALANALDSCRI